MPPDVLAALEAAREREAEGSIARETLGVLIENSRIAEADAKARNRIIEEFGKHNEEKINELEDKLAKEPPEAVCRASESDLRWLRGIK